MSRSVPVISGSAFVILLGLLGSGLPGHAQQATGQQLIAAGFNPIAATTPDMVAKLNTLPPNQFVTRNKNGRTYYVYADPQNCTCAYVGGAKAMNKFNVSYGALPADAMDQPGGGRASSNLERDMIDSMDDDEAGAQFNKDVFGPDF